MMIESFTGMMLSHVSTDAGGTSADDRLCRVRRHVCARTLLHLHLDAAAVGLARNRFLLRERPRARSWRAVRYDQDHVGLRVLPRALVLRVRRSALDSTRCTSGDQRI